MIENGIILVDKPAGISSFGVVSRVRWQLSQHFGRKMKVGHTGTLDPFATGLMILVVGTECKNAGHYSKLDKIYDATIKLGETSTTGDPEGEITLFPGLNPGNSINKARVKEVMKSFVGEIEQTPPVYSAIKVGGQRAYKLAREGKKVVMPTRQVKIYSLELVKYNYPELKIRAHVSSGTYIRTLAEDIGTFVGTGAYCSGLRRVQVGELHVQSAQRLSE